MRVYLYDIRRPLTSDELAMITSERHARAARYRKPDDRRRCLAAGLLMARWLGIQSDNQLEYGKNGKPRMKDGGVCFNLSHSGNFVVMAVAQNELGVDIELMRPYPKEVAKRWFTPEESAWLASQESGDAFWTLWTAKESVMKGLGLGLEMAPGSFSVLPIDESKHIIANRTWYLTWHKHHEHTICTAVENFQEEWVMGTGRAH
jgi:4'-phosphopantetheinyl transferase